MTTARNRNRMALRPCGATDAGVRTTAFWLLVSCGVFSLIVILGLLWKPLAALAFPAAIVGAGGDGGGGHLFHRRRNGRRPCRGGGDAGGDGAAVHNRECRDPAPVAVAPPPPPPVVVAATMPATATRAEDRRGFVGAVQRAAAGGWRGSGGVLEAGIARQRRAGARDRDRAVDAGVGSIS